VGSPQAVEPWTNCPMLGTSLEQNPRSEGQHLLVSRREGNRINDLWSGRWESNPRPKLGKRLLCSQRCKENPVFQLPGSASNGN
jgi:hypothetical protein